MFLNLFYRNLKKNYIKVFFLKYYKFKIVLITDLSLYIT